MQGNSILDVKKITGYLGKWSIDEDGTVMAVKVITDEVITQKLTVGSVAQPSGITLYDEITKEPYCVKIKSGAVVNEAGICGTAQTVATTMVTPETITATSTPAAVEPAPAASETASSTPVTADTTAVTATSTISTATTTQTVSSVQ